MIVDNLPALRFDFQMVLKKQASSCMDDKGALDWLPQARVLRDQTSRFLSLSQELYVSDVVQHIDMVICLISFRSMSTLTGFGTRF